MIQYLNMYGRIKLMKNTSPILPNWWLPMLYK